MLRSVDMRYYNMIMPRESAWHILNQIGTMDTVHFVDMQSEMGNFNRPFYNQVKRCEDLLTKVEFMRERMKEFGRVPEKCESTSEFLT